MKEGQSGFVIFAIGGAYSHSIVAGGFELMS